MGHAKVALNLLKYGAVKCEQTDDVSFIKPTKHAKHNRQGFSSKNMFGGGGASIRFGHNDCHAQVRETSQSGGSYALQKMILSQMACGGFWRGTGP